jgi:antitoxin component YwqK of YwqJK toxin-antitoxin module
MSFRFCIFTLFLLLIGCIDTTPTKKPAPTREQVDYFENKQVSRRYHLINGLKQGKMTDYYNDGKLMAERYFLDDAQHGRTLIFYPSGAIKEVQYFVNGTRQGGDTLWYENGKVQFVTTLKDDKKDGYLRKWSPEGKLVYEARYERDTLVEVMGKPIADTISAARPSKILKKSNRQ